MSDPSRQAKSNLQFTAPLLVAPYHGGAYPLLSEFRQSGSTRRRAKRTWQRLPRGLWNAGQSCHAGVSISALSAVPEILHWLRKQDVEPESPFAKLKLYLLEASGSSKRHGLDPRPILRILEESGWKSRHAQDAHETMSRILHLLTQWSRREENRSPPGLSFGVDDLKEVSDVSNRLTTGGSTWKSSLMPFSIVTSSFQKCIHCGHQSEMNIQIAPTVILPASEEREPLSSLFVRTHISRELVEMRCYECGKYEDHMRTCDVKHLPNVLIIHLQKAIFLSGYTKTTVGNAGFPATLLLPERRPVHGRARLRHYSLRSVVRHWGHASGRNSHFDSIVRQDGYHGLASISKDGLWWEVNDDRIQRSSVEAACRPGISYIGLYQSEE